MCSTYDATTEVLPPPLPRSPCGSPTDEARHLVHRCAEPRPVGDSIKAAIYRSAKRLGFTFSRTRDLWYANARRIDAWEMDRLRERAAGAEIKQAMAGLEILRNRLSQMPSPACRELVAGIDAALHALARE
jgi:hypothetical protein